MLDGTFLAARGDSFHSQKSEKIFLAICISGRGHGNESAALQSHYEPLERKEATIIPKIGVLLAGRLQLDGEEHTAEVNRRNDFVCECLL